MKVGDLVAEIDLDRIGIITKIEASRDWVWVEMMWERDGDGLRPLGEHNRTGWYDIRDVEIYHASR